VKSLFLVFSILMFVGCGTIRLDYRGEVIAKNGKPSQYRMKKSYQLEGPDKTFCALTAVFLGGYCWYYLVMPTTQQSARIENDAKLSLAKKLGENQFTLARKSVKVDGWSEGPDESVITSSSILSAPFPGGLSF